MFLVLPCGGEANRAKHHHWSDIANSDILLGLNLLCVSQSVLNSLFLLPRVKVFLILAHKGKYLFLQEARPTQEFLTLAQHPAALLCPLHLLKLCYKLNHQNYPDWETMQGDIFTQRHEWCLTIYTVCNSLLAKTCKEGQGYTTNTCAASLLFHYPQYQTHVLPDHSQDKQDLAFLPSLLI